MTMARLPGFDLAPVVGAPPRPVPRRGPAPRPVRLDDERPVDPDDDLGHDDDELLPDAPPTAPFTVEVVRSKKRTRTVGASMVDGVLRVAVPSWMSRADEARWVEEMTRRYLRKNTTAGIDLMERAVTLARRHDLPRPRTVRWVDMRTRWGSCTPAHGSIRIDRRLGAFPPWVLDYVLVHELSHLEVLDHGPAFWKLVARYPRSERAIGYLVAKSETS
jgi:predicted metal-dependent hydrolase